jgi:hypothetical protein
MAPAIRITKRQTAHHNGMGHHRGHGLFRAVSYRQQQEAREESMTGNGTGEKTLRPKTSSEDDYFRKLEQELMVALREKSATEIEQAIRAYTRMRCPKCGEPLAETPARQITIDACPGCGGIWLDKGEWEGLVGPKEHGWLQQLFTGLMVSKP